MVYNNRVRNGSCMLGQGEEIPLSFGETFSALSDPVRREILSLLRQERRSAGDIAGHFSITPAAISYHLRKLKEADLVREAREKNFIYYELNASVFQEALMLSLIHI